MLSWPCLLLLITLYLVVINKSYSQAPKSCLFVFANGAVVALFVVIGQIIFSCGQ